MNKIQRDIKELCERSAITNPETINKIITAVYESGLDFSECTQREFNRTVNECAEMVVHVETVVVSGEGPFNRGYSAAVSGLDRVSPNRYARDLTQRNEFYEGYDKAVADGNHPTWSDNAFASQIAEAANNKAG